jgi:hypothetical protein
MRSVLLLLVTAGIVGCAPREEQPAADTTAAVTTGPAPISLADLAGTWDITTTREGSDSVLTTSQLMATADTTGWMQHLPNRDPIPVRVVSVAGDSVVTEAGPFESVLRPGVQVSTTSVMRLQNGQIVGTTVARYSGPKAGADTVLRLNTKGTRRP